MLFAGVCCRFYLVLCIHRYTHTHLCVFVHFPTHTLRLLYSPSVWVSYPFVYYHDGGASISCDLRQYVPYDVGAFMPERRLKRKLYIFHFYTQIIVKSVLVHLCNCRAQKGKKKYVRSKVIGYPYVGSVSACLYVQCAVVVVNANHSHPQFVPM